MKNLNTHPEVTVRQERALLIAHELADVLKVREVGGNNKGERVEEILKVARLSPGDPWCAAMVYYCLIMAGVKPGELPSHPGSVWGFVDWATKKGRRTSTPERGDLFFWLDGSHGHIGFLVELAGGYATTLEGNTGDDGGRDGDGSYRKRRNWETVKHSHAKAGFVSLKGV